MSPSKRVPVKIIVDVHERQSGIAETLSGFGAEIEVAPLPAGGCTPSYDWPMASWSAASGSRD